MAKDKTEEKRAAVTKALKAHPEWSAAEIKASAFWKASYGSVGGRLLGSVREELQISGGGKKKSGKKQAAKKTVRPSTAGSGITDIENAVKFAKDFYGGNLDTAIKQLESLEGRDIAATLAALNGAKKLREILK